MLTNENRVGYLTWLQLILITLKLLNKISWDWVFVLIPWEAWIVAVITITIAKFIDGGRK